MTTPPLSRASATSLIELNDKFQDPYALWAVHTNLRAFKRNQDLEPPVITFLLELTEPYSKQSHFTEGAGAMWQVYQRWVNGLEVTVPEAYERVLPKTGKTPTFITLRLDISQLKTPAEKLAAVQAVMATSYVKRLQIGFPRPGFGPGGGNPEQSAEMPTPISTPEQGKPPPPAVVLGVLEDGCPFAHASLLRDGYTRVAALWDQSLGRTLAPPWTAPVGFPYGHQVVKAAMDTWLDKYRSDDDRSVDEQALYADAEVAMPALVRRNSHAAAVIGLLAGDPAGLPAPDDSDNYYNDSQAWPGPRQAQLLQAPLVAVRLPQEQTSVSAGRWLAVNALDGLHYITAASLALGGDGLPPPPTVVNVSYGAIAGPHDGSSMLESAMDELCAGQDDLAIVLATGNTFGTVHDVDALDPGTCLAGGVHAQQALPAGQSIELTLHAPADKAFETYLELWFTDPGNAPNAIQPLHIGEVQVNATGPDGTVYGPVPCGSQLFDQQVAEKTTVGLLFPKLASQSSYRSMALLVLAATRVHPEFVSAPAGLWTITISNLGPRALQVQAWVERDDTTVGANRPQSARLVPNRDGADGHLTDRNIFSNIASGVASLTVGALVNAPDLAGPPGSLKASGYSAAGPSNAQGPLLSAVADTGAALPGIRVTGNHSGCVLRTNGTSMAAPRAARWIADQLGRGAATLDQIRADANANRIDARRGKQVP